MPRKKPEKKEYKKKNLILRKRACRFCVDKEIPIDYKFPRQLTTFLTERGKLVSRRMTGNCSYHQRRIVESVKRARFMAFLPFSVVHSTM